MAQRRLPHCPSLHPRLAVSSTSHAAQALPVHDHCYGMVDKEKLDDGDAILLSGRWFSLGEVMKPFLRWAGGKSRLADRIAALLPPSRRLVEPFTGSGAVFLGVERGSYLLADSNRDLIDLYRLLAAAPDAMVEACGEFFTRDANTDPRFHELRAEFNAQAPGSLRRAALFVYLNRHCFNGLCRYNAAGRFNVPFGRVPAPRLPEAEMRNFARQAGRATFLQADFRRVMAMAEPGDVVYCDPPYAPLSPTASFNCYAAGGFSAQDQADLAAAAIACAGRGIPVLVSNHDTALTRQLYAGAEIHCLSVTRSVSGAAASRVKAAEILAMFAADTSPSMLLGGAMPVAEVLEAA